MKSKKAIDEALFCTVVLCSIFAAVVLVLIALYAHPCVDDYVYSLLTHEAAKNGSLIDVLGAAIETHVQFTQDWLGLYSPAALQSLQPGIFGDGYYWITCPVMLVVLLLGFLVITRSLTKYVLECETRVWVPLGTIMWLCFVLTMPSTSEGLYWWNGAANYIPFWTCFLFAVSFEIRYCTGNGNAAMNLIMASLLAFIVAGGTQTNSFAMILMLGFLAVAYSVKRRRFLAFIPFVIALIGFYLMATHPGIVARAADHGGIRSVATILTSSLKSTRIQFNQWVDLNLVLTVILMLPFFISMQDSSRARAKFAHIRTIVLFAILSTLYITGMNCAINAAGLAIPGRVENVTYATFVVLISIEAYLITAFIRARMSKRNKSNENGAYKEIALYAAIAIVLLFNMNNLTEGIKELRDGSLETYSQEIDARYEMIDEQGDGDVEVPALTQQPKLVYFDDITPDVDDWRNTSYAQYFGLNSIRTSVDE